MGNEKINYIIAKIKKRPFLLFTVSFFLFFAFFLVITPVINKQYARSIISISRPLLNSFINKNKELKRIVLAKISKENPVFIQYQIKFLDKKFSNGNIVVKMTQIDSQKEFLYPSFFLLALILATPVAWKRKLWSLGIGFLFMNLYLIYKILIQILDNYKNPYIALFDLPEPFYSIIYYSNYFLHLTGFSSSYVIPVVIWVISVLRMKDLDKMKEMLTKLG